MITPTTMKPSPIAIKIYPFVVHVGSLYMNDEDGPIRDSLWSLNIIPRLTMTSPIIIIHLSASFDTVMH